MSVLGEKDETYGFTYWGHVYESDYPVRFSSHQVIDDIRDKGRKIVAEDKEVRQGKKGEYLQLKKVKLDTGEKEQPSLKDKWDERSGSQGEGSSPKEDASPTESPPRTQVPQKPAAKLYNPDYAKDLTDIPIRLFTGNLNYAKDLGLNLIDNQEDRRKYYEYIQDVTDELLRWTLNIRSGEDIKKTADKLWPNE